MPKLIITIVNAGTPEVDITTGLPFDHETGLPIKPSIAGHTWYTIRSDDGTQVFNYGFAPDKQHQGQPSAPGEVYKDDQLRYQIDLESGDHQFSSDITKEQFDDLKEYGDHSANHGFDPHYNAASNSCINFLWKALDFAKFNTGGFQGDLLPTWNANNIENLLSGTGDHVFSRVTPQDLDLTPSQYLELVADNFRIHPVDVFNLDKEYFSQIFGNHDSGNITYTAYRGNQSGVLNDQELISQNNHNYLDSHHHLIDPASLILNINIGDNNQGLSLVRNDARVTLIDNATSPLTTLIEMRAGHNSALNNFMTGNHFFDNSSGADIASDFINANTIANYTNLHNSYLGNDSSNFDYRPSDTILIDHISDNFIPPNYFDNQTTINSIYSNDNNPNNNSYNFNYHTFDTVPGGHASNNFIPPNYFDNQITLSSSYLKSETNFDHLIDEQENNEVIADKQLEHIEISGGDYIFG